ncbi:MAG: deoxyribose-phosphate aldolase [Firmicutes bacterium]|nr:deoxyribose-phosphate aldolase [Bacillota bacterium]MBQ9604135.1 deoxyribose-phosphate aldolase [Bacillota bacterium]
MKTDENIQNILSKVDHTLLSVTATWDEIRGICDDGIKYQTASVCIPPSFVKRAADYAQGRVKICTVIGFPNGYNTAEVKAFEAKCAVKDGADEIDMVINQGDLKEGRHATVLTEINRVKEACGDKLLKVIIETCNLTDEEKVNMCRIVEQSDADFIKTSTGFGKNGATFEDIALFAENIKTKKIKAAGGIKSIADAEKFIELGADRLGTSRIVKIVKES